MRLCILVMAADNTHACRPEAEPGRWRRGEIVDVFDADARGMVGPDPHPKFVRVYVTDWPRDLDAARQILLRPHVHSTDVDAHGKPKMLGRRRRVIPASLLTAAVRNKLQQDRFIEATVAQVRDYIRRRAPDIEARLQADTDTLADDVVLG